MRITIPWFICATWFLIIPNLLFQTLWLRFPFNVLLLLTTIYGGIVYSKLHLQDNPNRVFIKEKKYFIGALLIAAVFVYFSGAGGFVWQKPDWLKHNVVLHDLISYAWPVQYAAPEQGPAQTLVYYLGYYLVPSIFGKWLGWDVARIILYVQTVIGVLLFAQIARGTMQHSLRKLFLFFFLSGPDILGILIFHEWPNIYMHIENYAIDLQFSWVLTQLGWVPQHALAGWIGIMLAYHDYKHNRLAQTLPFLIGITLLWSPFVALGIFLAFAPFYLSMNMRNYIRKLSLAGFHEFSIESEHLY